MGSADSLPTSEGEKRDEEESVNSQVAGITFVPQI